MKVITWNGIKVDKPAMQHNPQVAYTIRPAKPIPFNVWSDSIKDEIMGKEVDDVLLVKVTKL